MEPLRPNLSIAHPLIGPPKIAPRVTNDCNEKFENTLGRETFFYILFPDQHTVTKKLIP